MTELKVNLSDYLSESDIKGILEDELRNYIRKEFSNEGNARRLLSNLSYQIVFDEIDKTIPNSQDVVKQKTLEIVNNIKSYSVFRYHYSSDVPESVGAKIIEETVKENTNLIKEKVKETIINKDYSEKIWDLFEKLADNFGGLIYSIAELGRNKTKE